MKRATITLSDDLEAELEAYRAAQAAPPSLTSLVQAALRSFLAERGAPRGHRAAAPPASEVAEGARAYGTGGYAGGVGGGPAWPAPAAPRMTDLPGLLAGLPRLSEPEARELADDLDRAREEMQRGELHDPWSPPGAAIRGGEPDSGRG